MKTKIEAKDAGGHLNIDAEMIFSDRTHAEATEGFDEIIDGITKTILEWFHAVDVRVVRK